MYLQFYINENGEKVYTTKKDSPIGLATQSAHPGTWNVCYEDLERECGMLHVLNCARFSPDDKHLRRRVL